MFISEPQLVSLKPHGKREVLQLIDQMEETLVFDLDKVEPWWGRAASAITPGHWFHGVNIESGGVQQGADLPKGPWQISVRSCEYSSLAMGKVAACKVVAFH